MRAYPILQLSDIADVVVGDPAPQDPKAFAPDGPLFVRMQDVGRHHRHPALANSTDHLNTEWIAQNRLRLFPKGSILIPKSGASVNLNHRAKLATDAYAVSHLAIVIPDQARVEPDYLYWWSTNYDPRAQAQVTSLPSLKLSTLKSAPVPLPPLDEQRRIVGILNRAAKIERLRKRAQGRLREFIPALFVNMFGDPVENPMGWKVTELGDCCRSVKYGTSKKANDLVEGMPVLRMGNVNYDGELDCTSLKYVLLPNTDIAKYELRTGDIVFNRTNSRDLVGKTGLWDGRFPAVAASYFIRLRLDETRVCPNFVWAFMNSSSMKKRLFEIARGAIGQANINAKELNSLLLPVPPLDLQLQYTQMVGTARSIIAVADAGYGTTLQLSAVLLSQLLEGIN